MDWQLYNQRSVTNLPRQVGLGGYNEYINRSFPLHHHSNLFLMKNPQAHRSTEELKTIVKALSKLRLLNTPEEDQRPVSYTHLTLPTTLTV